MSLWDAWAARPVETAQAARQTFLDGRVVLHVGDSLDILDGLEPNSIDSVVTDPPYHLTSVVKRFGPDGAAPAKFGTDGLYARQSRGFMGKIWDGGDIAFQPLLWAKVLRVLKPGGHMVAFSGTRTYHRMACAIEDAGFEIRNQLAWVTGQGFPKSLNINKALLKAEACCVCNGTPLSYVHDNGTESTTEYDVRSLRDSDVSSAERDVERVGGILQHGVQKHDLSECAGQEAGAEVRSGQSGVERGHHVSAESRISRGGGLCAVPRGVAADGAQGRLYHAAPDGDGVVDRQVADEDGVRPSHQPQSARRSPGKYRTVADQCRSQTRGGWPLCDGCGKPVVPKGMGTDLKPAWEPICLARKPLSEGTVVANVLAHGTGGLNVDGCRIEAPEGLTSGGNKISSPLHMDRDADINRVAERAEAHALGRFPANLCHDGSPEVLAGFPESKGQQGAISGDEPSVPAKGDVVYGFCERVPFEARNDSGSAARFFYCAKASKKDRAGSKHPTVKPVALMRWLARLVTPPGGTLLDPFAGSGTTGQAAHEEGFRAVLCERETEYAADIAERMRRLGSP